MGVIDKLLDVMSLNMDDEDDAFDNEDYNDYEEEEEAAPRKLFNRKEKKKSCKKKSLILELNHKIVSFSKFAICFKFTRNCENVKQFNLLRHLKIKLVRNKRQMF